MVQLPIALFGGGYMPHGTCFLWQPGLMTVHAVSDGLIGLSYIAIAAMLGWLVLRLRGELPFRVVFAAFGLFIVACGMTHLLEVYTLWQPAYWLSGGVKVVTALASVATALLLPTVVPAATATVREARLSTQRQGELELRLAELRESESRFREAFERAPIGKGLVALDGRWLRVNRALCEITGYSEDELLHATMRQLTHPEDLGADLELAQRLAAGEIASYQAEKRYVRKDGRTVWVLLNESVIRDADDLPLYFIAQVLDITERKAAEDRERQLARAQAAQEEAEAAASQMEFLAGAGSTLASSLDYDATIQSLARVCVPALGDFAVVDVLEEDGRIRRVAAAHAEPAREEVAQELRAYPPNPDAEWHPAVRTIHTGRPVVLDPFEVSALGPDAVLPLHHLLRARAQMTVPLIAGGRTLGALTVALDERSPKRLGPTDVALAEEVARRAAMALENAALFQEAEQANRAKSDFLTVMSHELRTPLNAIVGYTDLLQAGLPGPLTEQQKLYLDRIRRSSGHLLSLIEEVLTYSRLEAGRETVRREVVDLEDVIQQACALIEPLAVERGLRFQAHPPERRVRLESDARKIRQMLANLLSNAVKFTERGMVEIATREEEDVVAFDIRDTGIGIAPEHLEKIFEPFWQADSGTTRRAQGTGLGLGVTRRLARLLGGDVTVRSELGAGTTFTLRLPRR